VKDYLNILLTKKTTKLLNVSDLFDISRRQIELISHIKLAILAYTGLASMEIHITFLYTDPGYQFNILQLQQPLQL